MSYILIDNAFTNSNQELNQKKKVKKNNINHKGTISYNKFKTPRLSKNVDKEQLRTGDRFIPFRNDKDNFQNFLFNTPLFLDNKDKKNYSNNIERISPLEEKPEKNYANFIVDNMLRTNADQYNFTNSKKFRSNSILTFSRKISFNSIRYNSSNNNNQNKKATVMFENVKFNNSNVKSNNENKIEISKSSELLKLKNKSNKANSSKKKLSFQTNLIYEDESQNINQLFSNNGNSDINNNDLLFKFFEPNNYTRSVLPDSDYLLANYSNNQTYKRKINLIPEKILDAPNLVDDYYLNLLEWGKANVLAVALGPEIYLWNSETSETSCLMSILNENSEIINNNDVITSLSWMNNGTCLGIGLPNGKIELWDIEKCMKKREIKGHKDRVSSLAWNNYIISSGSKDKLIKNFDVRCQDGEISTISQHKQEVCALKYSPEGDLLSSGGNDNTAYIWDVRKLNHKLINISNIFDNNSEYSPIKPFAVNNSHIAAVKAMSWCPWQRHILSTGGGTKDKTIKIFNCDTNKITKNVETGSQVCSLLWNKREREIISSHGFNKNQITIWNYQKMKKVCELKGHMSRVLYLTMSPDENYICSGSSDETLRFWKINEGIKEVPNEEDPLLSNVQIR